MKIELPKDTWVKVIAPVAIRMIGNTHSKGLDWKEESVDDVDGPSTPDVFSVYKSNANEPLTTRYVNIWVRSSGYSVEIDANPVKISC